MWETKVWKIKQGRNSKHPDVEAARQRMQRWIKRHQNSYQIEEVLVNNAFAVLVRRLRKIG